ncbi:sensor histidine kinase [Serinibacter arcticus]|uniref:histidine kinase n=1 Tax=Serinibacter arcticus TaxID=1655435 RepID=A0A4Z1EAI5_9MICO|nr:HAMP domain-containing sensor histidine kinase [Serinibacter arcticus]TGO06477.1 Two-component system, sensor protein [Serinibacter arcticus]
MRRPRRLRTQLIALVGLVALLVAVILGVLSALSLRSELLGRLDGSLVAASDRGRGADVDPGGYPDPPPGWDGGPPGLNVRGQAVGTVVVEVRDGEVVSAGYLDDDAQLRELDPAQAAAVLTAGDRPSWVHVNGLGTYRAVTVGRDDGTSVVTALPWDDSAGTLRGYVLVEVVVGVVAVLLAAAVATALVRRSLRPLDRVAQTATRVAELPLDRGAVALDERVPDGDTDPRTEVGQVGAALNRLLGHVETSLAARHASEQQVRQFVADASHELRTPLASIRGYSELVLRHGDLSEDSAHAVTRVASESRRMQALVEDLLLLARLDAGREIVEQDVDVVALAADAVSDAHAAGRGHTWRLDLAGDVDPERLRVRGDEARLRQVLVNLLANARVHTPPGTTVRLGVRRAGDVVTLIVLDDGPGVPAEQQATIFDRFSRGDAARTGGDGATRSTGLGLAIVEAIVTAHGGTITLDSEPGRTLVSVVLPASGAPDGGAGARMGP